MARPSDLLRLRSPGVGAGANDGVLHVRRRAVRRQRSSEHAPRSAGDDRDAVRRNASACRRSEGSRARVRRRRQPDPDGVAAPGQPVRRHRPLRPPDRGRAQTVVGSLGLGNIELRHAQHPRRGRDLRRVRLHHLPRRVLLGPAGGPGQDPVDLRRAPDARTASPTSATTPTPGGTSAAWSAT